MHTIVKGFGLLQVVVGVAVAFLGASMASDTVSGALTVLMAAFGIIVSGALFWCFGAIVEHLIAIRRALEGRPLQ